MKQITTTLPVSYATGMGTLQTGLLKAVLPSFTGTFETLDMNWRYYTDDVLVKSGSRMFPSTGTINDVFEAVKPYMVKDFDSDFSGALEEAFYLAFKFEMYQTLLTFNPGLTLADLVIEDVA